MLDKVLEKHGLDGASFFMVENRGTALVNELLVMGGQDVRKTGLSGNYRTGYKTAIGRVLDAGLSAVTMSEDEDYGQYIIVWSQQPGPEQNVGMQLVAHVYSETFGYKERVLDYTLHVGHPLSRPLGSDNNTMYRSLAQFVINAAEAARVAGSSQDWDWFNDVELSPLEHGRTRVYIERNEEVDEVWQYRNGYYFKRIDRLALGHKIADLSPEVSIWTKTCSTGEDGGVAQANFYFRDIGLDLAYLAAALERGWEDQDTTSFTDNYNSAFDYVVSGAVDELLSSEREFANKAEMLQSIGEAWAGCRDVTTLAHFLKATSDGTKFESKMRVPHGLTDREIIKQAWEMAYGNSSVAMGKYDNARVELEVSDLGKSPVRIHNDSVLTLLEWAGVPTGKKLAGYVDGRQTRPPTKEELRMLVAAEAKLKSVGLTTTGNVVYRVIMHTENYRETGYHKRFDSHSEIGVLAERILNEEDALRTLYHEHVHARTGALDWDRAFHNQMAEDIVSLIGLMS